MKKKILLEFEDYQKLLPASTREVQKELFDQYGVERKLENVCQVLSRYKLKNKLKYDKKLKKWYDCTAKKRR